ncbi:MAG: single-stranded DNA-binding protein [Oscillospiraceae bacterium]|nr:single-stranded DNA-binding protein [Oscillospiraceae bacterium]
MLNHVTLQGRITRDPELKTTTSSVSTCSFTLAVDRSYKSGEQKADFINCVAWRSSAEFITRYFKKGDMFLVEGSIQTRSWEKDSKRYYATEVLVDRVHFCGRQETQPTLGAPATEEAPAAAYGGLGEPIVLTGSEDDLPF